MTFDRHATLKYQYGHLHFWCREYGRMQQNSRCRMHQKSVRGDSVSAQMSFKEYTTRLRAVNIQQHENRPLWRRPLNRIGVANGVPVPLERQLGICLFGACTYPGSSRIPENGQFRKPSCCRNYPTTGGFHFISAIQTKEGPPAAQKP